MLRAIICTNVQTSHLIDLIFTIDTRKLRRKTLAFIAMGLLAAFAAAVDLATEEFGRVPR